MISARNFKIVEMDAAILSIALLGFAFDRARRAIRARALAWYEGEAAA